MKVIKSLFSKILNFFTGGQAEKAFNAVADLVPKVLPIVQMVAAITPTRADDEIIAAFQTYGVAENVALIRATPTDQRGGLLMQLATTVASRQWPGLATNILQSAIQLAVTGLKAK